MELQPQSSKQNYLLRLGLWGNRNNKSWKEAIGFDEVCLRLAKTFSFLRVSWKCLQNIPGLVLLLKYSSVFYLTVKSQILPSDMHAKTPTLIRRIVGKYPKCRRVLFWYALCFLRSKFWAQASSYSHRGKQNFVGFQHVLGTSCSHPTGTTNMFHKKSQRVHKDCPQSTGYIRTVQMGSPTLWFMRCDEEVGRTACKNGIRH